MWSGASAPAQICREPAPSPAPRAPFDPRDAAQSYADATRTRASHVRDLRGRAECFSAPNGFIICVTRATTQFGGLLFGSVDALYHRHPVSTSRDGATRLYGLHDPLPPKTPRPYSDCALNPSHEPATQGCLSIRDEQIALQCGAELVELRRMDMDAERSWIQRVPLHYPPLQHEILSLGELADGWLIYRDKMMIPVAYGDVNLPLIFERERAALISPWTGAIEWLDPRPGCLLCEQASPITDAARIDGLRAQLPDVALGWIDPPTAPWAGECALYESMR